MDINVRKKLCKYYTWNIQLCGALTFILRKLDQKYMESFEMWFWKMVEKIIWTDRV